jgi:hypothetical protein
MLKQEHAEQNKGKKGNQFSVIQEEPSYQTSHQIESCAELSMLEEQVSVEKESHYQSIDKLSPYKEDMVCKSPKRDNAPKIRKLLVVASPSPQKFTFDQKRKTQEVQALLQNSDLRFKLHEVKSSEGTSELCMQEIISPFRELNEKN